MSQRSVPPAPPLRREAASAGSSFSSGASARRSRSPAAGGPAPRSSTSNSSSAAARGSSGPAAARLLRGAWATPRARRARRRRGRHLPGGGPWAGQPSPTLEAAGGCGLRTHRPPAPAAPARITWRKCALSSPGCAANRVLTSLPRRPDTRAAALAHNGVHRGPAAGAPGGESWSCSLGPANPAERRGGNRVPGLRKGGLPVPWAPLRAQRARRKACPLNNSLKFSRFRDLSLIDLSLICHFTFVETHMYGLIDPS